MNQLPTIRRFQVLLTGLVVLAFFTGAAFASVVWVVLSS